MSPAEKTGEAEQYYYNMITLEDPSSNICENEWAGPTPTGHTHYTIIVFRQGVWHEVVGPTPNFYICCRQYLRGYVYQFSSINFKK